jgi:hypothetical protein
LKEWPEIDGEGSFFRHRKGGDEIEEYKNSQ